MISNFHFISRTTMKMSLVCWSSLYASLIASFRAGDSTRSALHRKCLHRYRSVITRAPCAIKHKDLAVARQHHEATD